MTMPLAAESLEPALSWARHDCEQRIGFRGGRFTRVNNWLALFVGAAVTVLFYVVLTTLPQYVPVPAIWIWLGKSFTERGPTPYAIAFLSFWSLAILFIKSRKLAFQRRSLKYDVVPQAQDYVLSVHTADQVIDAIHATVDDPRHFVLFNRIMVALSNLKNLGRVTDVDDILRSQGEADESAVETSYALVRGFIWAIPVLGFIGTVLGLSQAIEGFSAVLTTGAEMSQVVEALKGVTAGMGTAFETTLQALVAALFIQMWLTFLKKTEEEFLDSCSDYCLRRIVGRLRLMPFEQD